MAGDVSRAVGMLRQRGYSREQIREIQSRGTRAVLDEARRFGFGENIQGVGERGETPTADSILVKGDPRQGSGAAVVLNFEAPPTPSGKPSKDVVVLKSGEAVSRKEFESGRRSGVSERNLNAGPVVNSSGRLGPRQVHTDFRERYYDNLYGIPLAELQQRELHQNLRPGRITLLRNPSPRETPQTFLNQEDVTGGNGNSRSYGVNGRARDSRVAGSNSLVDFRDGTQYIYSDPVTRFLGSEGVFKFPLSLARGVAKVSSPFHPFKQVEGPLYKDPDVQNLGITVGSAGAFAVATVASPAIATVGALGAVGYGTYVSGKSFIQEPSYEKAGEFAFVLGANALGVRALKTSGSLRAAKSTFVDPSVRFTTRTIVQPVKQYMTGADFLDPFVARPLQPMARVAPGSVPREYIFDPFPEYPSGRVFVKGQRTTQLTLQGRAIADDRIAFIKRDPLDDIPFTSETLGRVESSEGIILGQRTSNFDLKPGVQTSLDDTAVFSLREEPKLGVFSRSPNEDLFELARGRRTNDRIVKYAQTQLPQPAKEIIEVDGFVFSRKFSGKGVVVKNKFEQPVKALSSPVNVQSNPILRNFGNQEASFDRTVGVQDYVSEFFRPTTSRRTSNLVPITDARRPAVQQRQKGFSQFFFGTTRVKSPLERADTRQDFRVRFAAVQRTRQGQVQIQQPRLEQAIFGRQRQRQNQFSRGGFSRMFRQQQVQETAQKQTQRQAQAQILDMGFAQRSDLRFRNPRFPRPPRKTPPEDPFRPKRVPQRQSQQVFYDIFVRKQGRLVRVRVDEQLSRLAALEYGRKLVEGSARASYKIAPAGFSDKVKPFAGSPDLRNFYSKRGFLIEKNRFRINTPGELQQITALGLQALANPAANRFSFNFKKLKLRGGFFGLTI